MTDGDAILRTILERPEDDTPRLVLADWWEENAGEMVCPNCGDGEKLPKVIDWGTGSLTCTPCSGAGRVSDGRRERGEFVRVQVELARIPDPPPEPSIGMRSASREQRLQALMDWKKKWVSIYYALRRRERELLESHSPRWTEELRDTLPGMGQYTPIIDAIFDDEANRPVIGIGWYRGFVEAITCSLATLFGEACRACADPRPDCPRCHGTGRTPGIAAALFGSQPVRQVTLTDAVIHPSGGNMTYYVGGLGQFPRKYWRSLDNLPSRKAALSALSAACVSRGRELAKLPALEVTT